MPPAESGDAVEGDGRTVSSVTASPTLAILLNPYGIMIYNITKPNKVGLSVIQITNLSKYSK